MRSRSCNDQCAEITGHEAETMSKSMAGDKICIGTHFHMPARLAGSVEGACILFKFGHVRFNPIGNEYTVYLENLGKPDIQNKNIPLA